MFYCVLYYIYITHVISLLYSCRHITCVLLVVADNALLGHFRCIDLWPRHLGIDVLCFDFHSWPNGLPLVLVLFSFSALFPSISGSGLEWCEYVGMWACEYVSMWVCGHVGMWVCRCWLM